MTTNNKIRNSILLLYILNLLATVIFYKLNIITLLLLSYIIVPIIIIYLAISKNILKLALYLTYIYAVLAIILTSSLYVF